MSGIDLGTSNTCVAYWDAEEGTAVVFPLLQVYSAGKVVEQNLLPSMLYIARDAEVEAGLTRVPWSGEEPSRFIAGELARQRAVETPDRVVTSAKSWLCNQAIDRTAAVLPWNTTLDDKISPCTAAAEYLSHVRAALTHTKPELGSQLTEQVVVTVPASFDEGARSLTLEAAHTAGLQQVTLLEEPIAAMYAWLAEKGEHWRDLLTAGDCVLVCDVGGGTADFSLILVDEVQGELSLERISVGDHILLGGDNMDLALAYTLRQQLADQGTELDQWQFLSLVQSARKAKEQLLGSREQTEFPISIAGAGSNLFASTISTTLRTDLITSVVLDGFFPYCTADTLPDLNSDGGFQDFGLPYASDPALTKHLAAFLTRSRRILAADAAQTERFSALLDRHESLLIPNVVLFNGGVFNAQFLRERLLEVLTDWAQQPVRELESLDLDLAVCKGAAYYSYLKQSGTALRIRSGTTRSYYLGVEQSMPAVPGFKPPLRGLCIAPKGLEEGADSVLPDKEFGLRPGQKARFRFFASSDRAQDLPGAIIENVATHLEEITALEVCIPETEGITGVVPVRLHAKITELGILELWMKHSRSDQQWKLEFDVRTQE